MARHHTLIALVALACGGLQAQTVYRCTAPGGKVTMQQTPCGGDSAEAAKVYSAAPAAPAQSMGRNDGPAPRRHWIVWTNDPGRDAALAVANLDSIRLLGQSCEAMLRVRSDNLRDCSSFLQQMAPGGDFPRVGDKVNELVRDPGLARQAGMGNLRRAQALAQDITRIRDFVTVAMRQP